METEPMTELRQSRILLIEDSLADVWLVRLALREAGINFDLTALHDGAEALALVKGDDRLVVIPDLVLLDMHLPGNSGVEILAAIRSSQRLSRIPVVIMTSIASPHDMAVAQALGIAGQVVKSCDYKEFLEMGLLIKDILAQSAAPAFRKSASGCS